jgi:hypothetical protein
MLNSRGTWLALGVTSGTILGLSLAGVWPQVPVHAMATHGQDSFAIATGPVDSDVEAVFFLDYLTGDLKGAVLNLQVKKFAVFYQRNIVKDFLESKNRRYLMVTGAADLPRGNAEVGRTVIYIAELATGQLNAYAVPWSPPGAAAGMHGVLPIALLDGVKLRTVVVRGQ